MPKNPLYVVKDKDNIVEEVQGHIELWIKKLGIDKLIEMLEEAFHLLLNQARTVEEIRVIMDALDEVIERIKFFVKYEI